MAVQLQMLGTGDAHAKHYYNNNGLVLSPDYTLLIDCGTTAPAAIKAAGRSFLAVDAVLVTHLHDDHAGGLPELSLQLTQTGSRMTLLAAEALDEPLRESFLKNRPDDTRYPRSLDEAFDVKLLKPDIAYVLSAEITVKLIRTPHIRGKDSYSLLLNSNIFYSADIIFQPELLLKLVRKHGVSRIFHECQLTGKGVIHTSLHQLLSLPADIREMISLMHYSDEKPMYEGKTDEMTFLEQQTVYPL
ncbi:MBL fold metallo-hydrolase [Paenibacillus camerounensis]|uniref:MBL fold metallo-hydrolase n=1 Tax=Paenibacillus camerounensis TaxID=1243663 RepID=UPI0005AA7245|nr:MBL fold metallo-hydrolase [Paenibacillus camerounensis]